MDLLKTLLVYMTMVYASSVQSMPDAEAYMATVVTPTPAVTATAEPTPRPTAVPTVEVSVNPDYHTIQTGDKGDEVLRLQQALAEYGYYEGDLDGRFGQQTRRAVERFQYSHGLTADGIAGRNTLSVLMTAAKCAGRIIGPPMPPPRLQTRRSLPPLLPIPLRLPPHRRRSPQAPRCPWRRPKRRCPCWNP